MRVPVASITPYSSPNNGRITMQEPAWKNANVYVDLEQISRGYGVFGRSLDLRTPYEFLTEAGQWYLDQAAGWLYYIPLAGEDLSTASVELPLVETLIRGTGTLHSPIQNIQFKGLDFAYATWLSPSGKNGYVADQSAFLLVGPDHQPNYIGHDQHVVPSRGNLSFTFAKNILFEGNIFQHLGGVGLHFVTGCENTVITSNLFTDISSSAIILGGVSETVAHPKHPGQTTRDNKITNNLIRSVGVEYVDAAGIFIGFSRKTRVSHNTIADVPWSGIAMGWGWGLMDKGSFPGIPQATSGLWGAVTKADGQLWMYASEEQDYGFSQRSLGWWGYLYDRAAGPVSSKGASDQRKRSLRKTSIGRRQYVLHGRREPLHPPGRQHFIQQPYWGDLFWPPSQARDPLPYSSIPSDGNGLPYGSDTGGCRTYGDIRYKDNYWLQAPMPSNIVLYNDLLKLLFGFFPYSSMGFFDICRTRAME